MTSGATAPAYTDEMIATVEQLGPYIVIAPGIALAADSGIDADGIVAAATPLVDG